MNNEDFDSLFSYEIECLSILTDIDVDEFDDMEIDELSKIVKQVTFIKKQPSNIFKNQINNLTYIGLNDLKLGEFIDLDEAFNEFLTRIDFQNAIHSCPVLDRTAPLVLTLLSAGSEQNQEQTW